MYVFDIHKRFMDSSDEESLEDLFRTRRNPYEASRRNITALVKNDVQLTLEEQLTQLESLLELLPSSFGDFLIYVALKERAPDEIIHLGVKYASDPHILNFILDELLDGAFGDDSDSDETENERSFLKSISHDEYKRCLFTLLRCGADPNFYRKTMFAFAPPPLHNLVFLAITRNSTTNFPYELFSYTLQQLYVYNVDVHLKYKRQTVLEYLDDNKPPNNKKQKSMVLKHHEMITKIVQQFTNRQKLLKSYKKFVFDERHRPIDDVTGRLFFTGTEYVKARKHYYDHLPYLTNSTKKRSRQKSTSLAHKKRLTKKRRINSL